MTIGQLKRALRKVKLSEHGCWIWQGAQDSNGYGKVTVDYQSRQAHRVLFEAFKGAIPVGLVLDHLCRVPLCVNPAHLDAVTQAVNMRRGIAATRSTCARGHDLSPEAGNLKMTPQGHRSCRACGRMHARLKRQARWAQANPDYVIGLA